MLIETTSSWCYCGPEPVRCSPWHECRADHEREMNGQSERVARANEMVNSVRDMLGDLRRLDAGERGLLVFAGATSREYPWRMFRFELFAWVNHVNHAGRRAGFGGLS